MSGDDTGPDFNWLKQGVEKKKSAPPVPPIFFVPPEPAASSAPTPSEPEPSLENQDVSPGIQEPAATEEQVTPSEPAALESRIIEEAGDVELNSGIMEEFTADHTDRDESSNILFEGLPAAEVPSAEAAGETSDSDVPISGLTPLETPAESLDVSPADALAEQLEAAAEVVNESESPLEPESTESPVAAESEPPLEEPVGEPVAEADAPQETEVLEPDFPVRVESDTEVTRSGVTSEVHKGAGRWPDFAVGAAAAAAGPVFGGEKKPASSPFGQTAASEPRSVAELDKSFRSKKEAPSAGTVSRQTFFLVASYASVVTLAFLLLLIRELTTAFSPHRLESLPDIPNQKIENLTYVPANSTLPPGHAVGLGMQRRFGNILIEPVKITQEPAEFVHYTGDAKRHREATPPVWKLWIKLTNVSKDQTIAPLDRKLVLRWISRAKQPVDVTNYYITERGTRNRSAPSVQLYRLPVASDWDLKDQELGKELKPGESVMTYLASSDEGLETLGDDLVWRVQIRKGYSSQGTGVTTIFEVPFHKQDVIVPAESPKTTA